MSIASLSAFCDAFQADYASAVEDAIGLPTQYPNAPFNPPADAAWAELAFLFGDELQQDLGASSRRFRTTGLIQVTVHSKLHLGEASGLSLAEAVGDRYSGASLFGATFRSRSITPLGALGGWYDFAVRCAFFADRFR